MRNQKFTLEMTLSREVRAVPLRVIHTQRVIMNLRLNSIANKERNPLESWP